ncbi:hypothetical protein Tco_0617731 [Tanacetum coccineum]
MHISVGIFEIFDDLSSSVLYELLHSKRHGFSEIMRKLLKYNTAPVIEIESFKEPLTGFPARDKQVPLIPKVSDTPNVRRSLDQ